ncbi:MAG: LamG-like jellyroll fold domain-containing protein [Pseudomonadota bacterium]
MQHKIAMTIALLLAAPWVSAQTLPALPGLQLHLKSDAGVSEADGAVTTWADQSGNGFDLATTTAVGAVLSPDVVNGLPAVTFDGNAQLEGDLMQTLGQATVFTLARTTLTSSNNDYLYTIGNNAGSGSQMTLARRDGDDLYHYDGSVNNSPAESCVPVDSWLPVTQVYGGASPESHELYQDGVLALATTANNPYSVDATRFILGNWSSGAFRMVGDVVEVLVYDRALSASERAAVEAYLRARSGIDYVDFSVGQIVQYEVGQQNDATWERCAGDRALTQATNADPSIYLTGVDAANSVIRGTMGAGNAPDYMGFVIGFQDRSSYYLFDWKRTTASFANFGQADLGMTLRVIDTVDGEDPSGMDLWGSADTDNTTTLRDNDIAWVPNTTYSYTVRFSAGLIEIDIRDEADMLVESWSVTDGTFSDGQFGVFINSLQGVTFGPITVEPMAGADTDADGVPDTMDNCIDIANPDQRDSNGDGFGNRCDADLNDDCIVNVVDLGLLRSVFFTADDDADLSGDGIVNVVDLGLMRSLFFQVPGPSGQSTLCDSR